MVEISDGKFAEVVVPKRKAKQDVATFLRKIFPKGSKDKWQRIEDLDGYQVSGLSRSGNLT